MKESLQLPGELYGGVLISLQDAYDFQPISFPFIGEPVTRGNHLKQHDSLSIKAFDHWHAGNAIEHNSVFVAERGIEIDGRMKGENAPEVLRAITHRVLTINEDVNREDRSSILNMVSNTVLPTLEKPALISLAIKSSQSKFIILSRDIPLYVNVFCDDTCMLMVWTSDADIDKHMRIAYGERFSVFRMKPIVDSALIIHTYYLQKRMKRWKYGSRDRLKLLNALDAMVGRRNKGEPDEPEA